MAPLRAAERRVVANILRVDHAGEYAAIRIYEGQCLLARWRAPEIVPFLRHALEDERGHRTAFESLMRDRRVIPCRTLALWGVAGWVLGLATGILGRTAVLVCTEAVERTVHRHLNDQRSWLGDRDPTVADEIGRIQVEELEHLQFAEARANGSAKSVLAQLLDGLVAACTEALIWLSTYGASSRMARGIIGAAERAPHETVGLSHAGE